MEDMARLGLLEQTIRDSEKFNAILYEMLKIINKILESPHDYELRIINSDVLISVLQNEALSNYLKHIGFQLVRLVYKPICFGNNKLDIDTGYMMYISHFCQIGNEVKYPKEQTLSNLRIAQAAIERKIFFCNGAFSRCDTNLDPQRNRPESVKPKFTPLHVLKTRNPFLLKIQDLFNNMINYENEEVQQAARECIPIVSLQLSALDRVRDHQKMLKPGEVHGQDMRFDTAQLLELVNWFKYKFFSWVDAPECEQCGGSTKISGITTMNIDHETCKVELFKCESCVGGGARFPRYNDARTLLRTRRGRCGEWANCFALMCRSLGYDIRYVYDTTDHVWCEVFDYEVNQWVHVDPCEGKVNAPLLYSSGWGKQLQYVLAFSKDDLQDVTWRYTTQHKQVLSRRTLCTESELISAILALREHRLQQVSDARRRYVTKRTVQELVQLMVENKASENESEGRLSGSAKWRVERGEAGAGHVFEFGEPGVYTVRYCAAADEYRVLRDGDPLAELRPWPRGVYRANNVFRKVEDDWRIAYLARTEGSSSGTISWKLSAKEGCSFKSLSVKLVVAEYESGSVEWSITFDDEPPIRVKLGEVSTLFDQRFKSAVLGAELRGGRGAVGWQHAQLFRQPLQATQSALDIQLILEHDDL